MAGDKFNIRASSWYKKNGATPGSPNSIATDLVTNLISSLTGSGGPVHGAITSAQLTSSGIMPTSVSSFLSTQPAPGSTKPKAYLNWVLLDEQFKFVQSSSGAEQVPDESVFGTAPNNIVYPHTKNDLTMTKSGYLYVFVSNETPNVDVFFDNLQVTHIRGPILEETHYYPFGLVMAGISSKALNGSPENIIEINNTDQPDKGNGRTVWDKRDNTPEEKPINKNDRAWIHTRHSYVNSHNWISTATHEIIGIGIYETAKWGVAIFLAPETAGGSLVGAAAIP